MRSRRTTWEHSTPQAAACRGTMRKPSGGTAWRRSQDDPEALTNLAGMYQQGRGVKRDVAQAFQLCRKAAEAGYATAQHNLGLMYANGEGVARDYVSAYAWWELAADEIANAASLRDRMAKEMTPDQLARACSWPHKNGND